MAKDSSIVKQNQRIKNFFHGIWLFPAILTLVLVILSVLQINGSSIGVYHEIFYGNKNDPALIAGRPQTIRSDEWIVNTQRTIAQKNDNYKSINTNIGNGEDETLISDVPTNDWSAAFKPHNLGFMFLPFENAFSLKWWLMSYLLVLSSYFFILKLLPGKKLLASLLSLSFLFSPFIQWWYQYITLGPVYYSLFGAVVFMNLLNARKRIHAVLWAILLAYIAVCFTLILYPPFQIPCALIILLFSIGYLFEHRKNIDKKILKRNLIFFFSAIGLSLLIVGIFVYQRYEIIKIIQDTAYPGQRIIESGGYSLEHLLSSNLSPVLQSITRTKIYLAGTTNQSEATNFILLIPFLLIPASYLFYKKYKKDKSIDYMILSSTVVLIIMLAWLFVPNIDLLGKITLLNRVPLQRLLIGLGLLNFIFIVGFIRLYNQSKVRFSITTSAIYSLLIVIFYLLLDFKIMLEFPNFIDYKLAAILALPIAMIVFCIMRKYFKVAVSGLLLFSILSTFHINPIYQGTAILTKTPLSKAIQEIGKSSNKKWVSDGGSLIENFATMNGEGSLNGVYLYPQPEIWNSISTGTDKDIYNRYAHVNFSFYRTINGVDKPSFFLIQPDRFEVKIGPCDKFLQKNNVGFLITSVELQPGTASCANLLKKISYPNVKFYIYKLVF